MALPVSSCFVRLPRAAVAWALGALLLLICAAPASAAPPTVSALVASGVADSAAVLNASVNPGGLDTTYFFEYTTDSAYQASPGTYQDLLAGGDAGAGITARDVSAQVNGLQPNTTYHFRVDATNGINPVQGADQTFTTAATAQPPVVASVQASSLSDTTAAVSGTVNPGGHPASYYFEYGPDTGYATHLPLSPQGIGSGSLPVNVSAALTNLTPGTTYHYALVASGAGSAPIVDQTFTTTTAPTVTTGAASAITGTAATISGSANANGDPSTVYFQYGPTSAYGASTPGQSAQGSTAQNFSAALSGLSPSTPYHFRLIAVNGPDIAYGADQTFSTLAPPVLGSTSVQLPSDTTALLNTTVDPSAQATQYYVNYGPSNTYGTTTTTQTLPAATGAQPAQIPLTGLTANTTYHFQLVASNATGTTTGPDQVLTTPTPPAVATSAPTAITDSSATLQGSVTTNGFPTTYHYQYASATEYATNASYPHTTDTRPAADRSTETANLSQLSPATTYHYALVASNGTDTVTSPDQTFTTAPQPPPLAATSTSQNVTDSTANVAGLVNPRGDATTYQFQYGTSTSFGSATTPLRAGSGTAAIDVSAPLTGLTRASTYYFRTVATNSAGTTYGDTQTFTTTTPPTATTGAASAITGTAATISGSANANGDPSTVYFQYGPTNAYGSTTTPQTLTGTTDQPTSATLTGLPTATAYHYRLVAANGPDTTWGADQTFSTLALAVVERPTSSPTGDTAVTLGASVNPSAQTTTYYFNYGTSPAYGASTAPQTLAAGTTAQAVSAAVGGLTANTVYHFQLVASNTAGVTSGPDQAFTTPMAPAVSTPTATAISDTSVMLQGRVTLNGFPTTYHFEYASAGEYGASATYPHATAITNVGSTTGVQSEFVTIDQLTPNTAYHFRLVANQGSETFAGADQVFTTAAQPTPLAATTTTLNVTDSAASVAGLVNPRGYPTTYQFQYGPNTSYGFATAPQSAGSGSSAIDVSTSLTGLARSTTYYFRVVATNSAGSSYGDAQTFTTPGGYVASGPSAPASGAGAPAADNSSGAPAPSPAPPAGSRAAARTAATIAVAGPAQVRLQPNGLPVLDSGLNVTCPASAPSCLVTVRVSALISATAVRATRHRRATRNAARTTILASATITVRSGHTTRVQVTLGHRALRMLRLSHRPPVRVTVALPGTRLSRVRPGVVFAP